MGVIIFFVLMATMMSVVFTLGRDLLGVFTDMRDSWALLETRSTQRADTIITGPGSLSVQTVPKIRITLTNEGDIAVGRFGDWDVIFEIQQSPGLAITRLAHTTSSFPASNEWTVQGIYLDATALTGEIVDPGILNPGEEMIVLANPNPPFGGDRYGRVIFVTSNGATAKVMLLKSRLLHVLDQADLTVYRYKDDGTLTATSTLDGQNGDGRGMTGDDIDFWTTDLVDDKAYKYSADFSLVTSWDQDPANQDAAGLTIDGNDIWVVDSQDDRVYKYDKSGKYVSDFPLTFANATSTGITTDGTNIWVVDADDKVYKYDMIGTYVAEFGLTTANADPTGITTDGTNIWVVDAVDDKAYRYDMTGTFVSDFSLSAANGDPQGLTVTPR